MSPDQTLVSAGSGHTFSELITHGACYDCGMGLDCGAGGVAPGMISFAARTAAARDFAARWRGRGYEKGDTAAFWRDLLSSVVGFSSARLSEQVQFEPRTRGGGFIDVFIPESKALIEQKSLGVNLDEPEPRQGTLVTPFQQAKRYADSLPNNLRPDWIIVCNFAVFRVHSLNDPDPARNYIQFELAELGSQFHLLDFLIDPKFSRTAREEQVSIRAGAVIGELYDLVLAQYRDPQSAQAAHALNVLCVRLVFCLFAEDSGIFERDALLGLLRETPAKYLRQTLLDLFVVLDTPVSERDPYVSEALRAFPYVNGGLFRGEVEIPQLTEQIRQLLIEQCSGGTDWSQISPTVFGGVFESTLNPDTRRAGGMHYTSPANIHKVIDPLFLDDLKSQLAQILEDSAIGERARTNRLREYQRKLATIVCLDPASGSGNFLTETYIELRRLENRTLRALYAKRAGGDGAGEFNVQTGFEFSEAGDDFVKVSLSQFYGIEINDFAVAVARTALWIAEIQMNIETEQILARAVTNLPLRDSATIIHANALTLDWAAVLPPGSTPGQLYIYGNPPFIGQYLKTAEQEADMKLVWGKDYNGYLDYVTAWYKKAADFFDAQQSDGARAGEFAFVSTNSITQGQPVPALFRPLFNAGWKIRFAYRTFTWANESESQAHVHCVIIGMTRNLAAPVTVYQTPVKSDKATASSVTHLNGYLAEAQDVFIEKRSKPIATSLPTVTKGSQPTDGGNLIVEPTYYSAVTADPIAAKYVRKFVGARELLHGEDRWCLWMEDFNPADLGKSQILKERVAACREFRLASKKEATRKYAQMPYLFTERRQSPVPYLCIPRVVSENRMFLTTQRLHHNDICSDAVFWAPDEDGLLFGLISSSIFITWQRAIGGRLESRLRFSNTVVWNNFPLPEITAQQRDAIIAAGAAVLAARAEFSDANLADLYNPLAMSPALLRAHAALDRAVDAAFGLCAKNPSESQRLQRLFELYQQLTTR